MNLSIIKAVHNLGHSKIAENKNSEEKILFSFKRLHYRTTFSLKNFKKNFKLEIFCIKTGKGHKIKFSKITRPKPSFFTRSKERG